MPWSHLSLGILQGSSGPPPCMRVRPLPRLAVQARMDARGYARALQMQFLMMHFDNRFALQVERYFDLLRFVAVGHCGLTGRANHCAGAPAAIQVARIWRSSGVISVMLPGGIACKRAALISIRRAWRRISSGSSSTKPFGGAWIPGQSGSLRWH